MEALLEDLTSLITLAIEAMTSSHSNELKIYSESSSAVRTHLQLSMTMMRTTSSQGQWVSDLWEDLEISVALTFRIDSKISRLVII